jgi:hypothetical protein
MAWLERAAVLSRRHTSAGWGTRGSNVVATGGLIGNVRRHNDFFDLLSRYVL